MFLRRNRNISNKLPIEITTELLASALIIARDYKNNKKHNLTEIELRMIGMFTETLERNYIVAVYISQCLHRRMNGEKEGFD